MKHYDTLQGSFELARRVDGSWQLTLDDMEAMGSEDSATLENVDFNALSIAAAFEQAGWFVSRKLAEADDAREEALADEANCGTCGGSGGGPDPETACRACGGSGKPWSAVDIKFDDALRGRGDER